MHECMDGILLLLHHHRLVPCAGRSNEASPTIACVEEQSKEACALLVDHLLHRESEQRRGRS